MGFRGRPGSSFVAVLPFLLVAGCRGKAEIVGEHVTPTREASTYFPDAPSDPRKCAAGHYEGSFVSHPATVGGGINVSGTFSFDLESKLMGEFRRLADNSTLTGTGTTTPFTFDATIKGSANCSSGLFSSKIENGTLSFPGGGQASTFGFHGIVTGYYDEPPNPRYAPVFSGDWTVYQTVPDAGVDASTGPVLAGGTWSAFLVTPL